MYSVLGFENISRSTAECRNNIQVSYKFFRYENIECGLQKQIYKLDNQEKLDTFIRLMIVINKKFHSDAVYDSGSNVTVINQWIGKLLQLKLKEQKSELKTISGSNLTSSRAIINLQMGNITDFITLYVVKKNFYHLLLGIGIIRKFKLIRFDENTSTF